MSKRSRKREKNLQNLQNMNDLTARLNSYNEKNAKRGGGCLTGFIFVVFLFLLIAGCTALLPDSKNDASPKSSPSASSTAKSPDKPKKSPEKTKDAKDTKVVMTKNTGWEKEVKKIASKNKTPDQKYEEVMKLAKKNFHIQDASDFAPEIADEFLKTRYLNQPNDANYMLTQIYKSQIMNKQFELLESSGQLTTEMGHLQQFAFDYYQNTKYVYRGVDAVDSEAVKSNEAQMWKSFIEISKQ